MTAASPAITGLPLLHTERLILRAPRAADWPAFRAYRHSPRTVFAGGPRAPEAAAEQFAALFGHWILRGFGRLIAEDRATGQPLGHFGPLQWGTGAVELTWTLWSAEAEGRGFATEAARAMRDWTFGTLGLPEAIASIHADNAASHAIARKLGGRVIEGARPEWCAAGSVYRLAPDSLAEDRA